MRSPGSSRRVRASSASSRRQGTRASRPSPRAVRWRPTTCRPWSPSRARSASIWSSSAPSCRSPSGCPTGWPRRASRRSARGRPPRGSRARRRSPRRFSSGTPSRPPRSARSTTPTRRRASFASAARPVVKADGLAAGKGVFVCQSVDEALAAVDETMRRRTFGEAGARVVVEEFLDGEEASFMVVTDGTTVLPLAPAQDHKRIFDGDRGPNTGGMGAYSPAPVVTPAVHAHVMRDVMEPVVRALAAEGIPYCGVLYAGLMVSGGRAKVLEFNVRFGDPEAQAILVRLRSDLAELAARTAAGNLAGYAMEFDPRAAACVVLAAAGYPGPVEKGAVIRGLDALGSWTNGVVFHAATRRRGDEVLTDGGRVLGVTALGDSIQDAVAEAYAGVERIAWDGMQFRRDIGRRAMTRG